jgi:CHAT domain-containing protein
MARKWALFYHSLQSLLNKKILIAFGVTYFSCLTSLPVRGQNAYQLTDRAIESYQQGNFSEAIQLLENSRNILQSLQTKEYANLAKVYDNLCYIYLEIGNAEKAVENCKNAVEIHQILQDKQAVKKSKIFQSYALQKLGDYHSACSLLTEVLGLSHYSCNGLTVEAIQPYLQEIATSQESIDLTAWRNLGDNLRVIGKVLESELILETLETNSEDVYPEATFLSLGNTYAALGNLEQDRQAETKYKYQPWQCEVNPKLSTISKNYYLASLDSYAQVVSSKKNNLTILKAQLNRLKILRNLSKVEEAQQIINQLNLSDLPPSKFKIFAIINYAQNLACLEPREEQVKSSEKIIGLLELAIKDAIKIDDRKSHSYALGSLGGFYEYLGENTLAKQYTEQALILAQEFPDIAYQWQWQLGRILEAKEEKKQALIYYELAFNNLKKLRKNLLTINSDIQFSFRDNVEPLYRQIISLQLSQDQQNPLNSLYYIESLQLTELSNFLGCEPEDIINQIPGDFIVSLQSKLQAVQQISPKTAIIYPIVLNDRLVIILSSPEKSLKVYTTNVSANQVNAVVRNLRQNLSTPLRELGVKKDSQKLYEWMLKPLKSDLEKNSLETLVFILDSSLQNLPMAVLYDGKNYLIEKYAIAVVPSLQLLNPHPAPRDKITALLAGASNAPSFRRENLNPLPNVQEEIAGIGQQVKQENSLLEENFSQINLQQQINDNPFSIVHIASHGKFSSNPEQTYILDWNKRIGIEDLENLLQVHQAQNLQPIELLILSACETASGDRRAALGLAGISIRSGAESTLATLWQVNDKSTAQLMIEFYRNLQNPKYSKAEALRQAQLKFLREGGTETDFNRAYYWAPFVMVGNWL